MNAKIGGKNIKKLKLKALIMQFVMICYHKEYLENINNQII
jgi:hypothetical protein